VSAVSAESLVCENPTSKSIKINIQCINFNENDEHKTLISTIIYFYKTILNILNDTKYQV